MLKNKNKTNRKRNKASPVLPNPGVGERPWQDGPGLGIFIFIHLTLSSFSYLSFGHELRAGSVNKQVIGRERVGKAWGREETPGGPEAGRALYRREDEPVGEGDTVSGGSLEPHCLRKVFTCIHHARARHTEAPRGHLGEARPSVPQMVTPGPSLGLSVDLYSVGFYLQTPRLGRHIPGESQDSPGSHPCPESSVGSALRGTSPSLEA